ncbi:hypothetical protein GCM10007242_21600 [Pigmentiphaga litoralis]|uniref:hypothetical protein n=1 Tax=Pigmentiphaga litoralis TaxID=516702 RepID=UPI0016780EEE|nr:hypothetical protein [Pigmentiphaga litoralis]GGX14781.1 hypothetical protein GCM10007242_21600 [Pigmentiphaga litoralis]
MDNAKHLYTVLAIMGFVALPVLMNSERIAAFDDFIAPHARLFDVGPGFPGGRDMRPVGIAPAANSTIEQRWIDEASDKRCRTAPVRADGSHAPDRTPAGRCLIV